VKSISYTLSIVFSPLLIVTQLFWILLFVYPEIFSLAYVNNEKWILLHAGMLAFGTFLMPALSILALRILGFVSNYDLKQRKERMVPFYFITFWYCFSTYLFATKLQVGWHFLSILAITTMLIAILTLITCWYKISIHSASISGAAGFICAICLMSDQANTIWPLAITILAAGAIGSARLYLNIHTFKQVIHGSLLGFAICFFGLILLW